MSKLSGGSSKAITGGSGGLAGDSFGGGAVCSIAPPIFGVWAAAFKAVNAKTNAACNIIVINSFREIIFMVRFHSIFYAKSTFFHNNIC
jgi:hypothetical protein